MVVHIDTALLIEHISIHYETHCVVRDIGSRKILLTLDPRMPKKSRGVGLGGVVGEEWVGGMGMEGVKPKLDPKNSHFTLFT